MAYWTVCLATVFRHVHDGGMWELGDGEAICFWLFRLFLSVCWLEKLVLSHGAFVVALQKSRMIIISIAIVVTELLVPVFVCFILFLL